MEEQMASETEDQRAAKPQPCERFYHHPIKEATGVQIRAIILVMAAAAVLLGALFALLAAFLGGAGVK